MSRLAAGSAQYSPRLHAMAVLTAVVALLPILVGAITTTLDAGMAFPDWPTSNGYGMLSYPWLQSAGDQFVEHGHRLAGMLIGLVSIGLVGCAMRWDTRRSVRGLAWAVLLAVICQGLLGGSRVRLDARVLAMIHGTFAAVVFSLMGALALITSRGWREPLPEEGAAGGEVVEAVAGLRGLTTVATCLVLLQFVAGGFLRHLHTALHEHLGLAVVVTVVLSVLILKLIRLPVSWIRRTAILLAILVGLQLMLGGGAWITRFGLANLGYVAVQQSSAQLWLRTAHTLGGMLVLMTSVVLTCQVYRVAGLRKRSGATRSAMAERVVEGGMTSTGLPEGGAA